MPCMTTPYATLVTDFNTIVAAQKDRHEKINILAEQLLGWLEWPDTKPQWDECEPKDADQTAVSKYFAVGPIASSSTPRTVALADTLAIYGTLKLAGDGFTLHFDLCVERVNGAWVCSSETVGSQRFAIGTHEERKKFFEQAHATLVRMTHALRPPL
jgi:hypothetical protein